MHAEKTNQFPFDRDGCLVYASVRLLERMYKLNFSFPRNENKCLYSQSVRLTSLVDRNSSIDFKMSNKPIYGSELFTGPCREMILLCLNDN